MQKYLQPGESMLDVHDQWGEPDIRNYVDNHVQVWSYAEKANTNDMTAAIFYTAPKEGDSGRFLDLRFVDGRLASWGETDHAMPQKEGSGFTYGVNLGVPETAHY